MEIHKPSILENYEIYLPKKGESGSFLENRKDRIHCGIDLYAPAGTGVRVIEGGVIADMGIMTSPDILPYWNLTYYVIIKTDGGMFCKYAEMGSISVELHEKVEIGDPIGEVGMVLNPDNIDDKSPLYIQKLKYENPSMLHFELWDREPCTSHSDYLGGNWFGHDIPEGLLDPAPYILYRLSP